MQKTLVTIIILATLVFTIIIAASYRQTQLAYRSASLVAHTQKVLFNTAKVLATINENVTNVSGYTITGSGNLKKAQKIPKKKFTVKLIYCSSFLLIIQYSSGA